MLRFVVLFACLFAPLSLVNAQEKVRKTETISTIGKLTPSKLKTTEGLSEIKGIAVFTLASANNDGTLTGNLVYTLPELERQKIAQALNKPVTEIPANLTTNNLIAKFAKNTHCPDIHLEFAELDLELSGTRLHLNRFVLDLAETPSKLSRALCIWTDRTNKGVTNAGIVQYINLLLKGEEDEEQAK
ncbi:MAG: hypothetical protein JNM09_18100 [Blastocatellia bacterium]|nr:hypothetical protein [Blastocatellia bacterium]